MKVLHVLYSGLGGHSNVFFSMINADDSGEFEYQALFNGVEPVRDENSSRCDLAGIKWYYVHKTPGRHISFIWKLAQIIRKAKPRIVFLHASINVPAAVLAKLFSLGKFKIIVRETQANHLKTKAEWFSLKLAVLLANKTVFLTNTYNEEIKKKLTSWYKIKKTAVIPNGLDLSVFKPGTPASNGKIVLAMQSRIVAIKDHITLLHAVHLVTKQHPEENIHLKIAGEGNCEQALKELANSLGINNHIEFVGLLTEAELPAFLQSCNIYIHASLGETMSTAIMQAMACRLPIIASDVDGINNMLTDGQTGLLVKPKQPQLLADAIMRLINSKSLCTMLAENAYNEAINKFSNKKMFERYKAIFTE